MTAVGWLNLYLQVSSLKEAPKLLLPQYSQEQFIQIAQVSTGSAKSILTYRNNMKDNMQTVFCR